MYMYSTYAVRVGTWGCTVLSTRTVLVLSYSTCIHTHTKPTNVSPSPVSPVPVPVYPGISGCVPVLAVQNWIQGRCKTGIYCSQYVRYKYCKPYSTSSVRAGELLEMATLLPLSAAALTTATLMYPVDVLRALKMASAGSSEALTISGFYAKYGMKGFVSQGVIPELARASVMRVSKFFFFPIMSQTFWGAAPNDVSPVQKGIAGAFATVPEIVAITPLEVAKLGLQVDGENKFKNSSRAFIQHTMKSRGFGGLYVGWAGLQARQSIWTGTYFATLKSYREGFKSLFGPDVHKMVPQLLGGFCAGVTGVAIGNGPADVLVCTG